MWGSSQSLWQYRQDARPQRGLRQENLGARCRRARRWREAWKMAWGQGKSRRRGERRMRTARATTRTSVVERGTDATLLKPQLGEGVVCSSSTSA